MHLALAVLLLHGCASSVAISPRTLPRLNQDYRGAFANGPAIQPCGSAMCTGEVPSIAARSLRGRAEAPDGTAVIVRGAFDVEIGGADGEDLAFEHPVIARVDGDALLVAGANLPTTRIPLASIDRVEVVQRDDPGTVLRMALVTGLVFVVVGSIAVAAGGLRLELFEL